MKKLNLNAIRLDGGTQPRERIDMDVVADYAEAVKVGIEFPPVIVFSDGAENWLADGFHRWHAHNEAGKASIPCDVRQGSLKDAQLYAASREANGTHGLRRTNADKRLCVLMTLKVSPDWSDNRVAEHVGVDHKTVAAHRASILGNSQDSPPAVRTVERAGKEYQQDTSRIGKAATEKPPKKTVAPPAAAPERGQTLPPAEDFGPSAQEVAAAEREAAEEIEALRKVALADDKVAAALAEAKQLRALNRVLKERNDGLMNQNAELIAKVKRLQRQVDKLEKQGAPA